METEGAVCQFGIFLTTIHVRDRLISFFYLSSIWWGKFIFSSLLQNWTELLYWKALCQLCWSLKIQNEIKVHLAASYVFAINKSINLQSINNQSVIHSITSFLKNWEKSRHKCTCNFAFLCKAIYRDMIVKVEQVYKWYREGK